MTTNSDPTDLGRSEVQRIAVFQQNGSGEKKIRAVREHGRDLDIVAVFDIDEALPEIIDEPEEYLPDHLEADLVLDHLRHPDLTYGLALACREWGIPVIASGKRVPVEGLISPPTCCGLAEAACPGPYAEQFGLPAYRVALDPQGRVSRAEVTRGASCGATWALLDMLLGKTPEEAVEAAGLHGQLQCVADGSSWDPIWGHSPIHFAGRVHAQAVRRALVALGLDLPKIP